MSDGGPKLDRVPSGIAGLDTILHGGFLKGGLYIVGGPPGAGKTTLANQICFNTIARLAGGRALYVTLLAEYHARMMQHLGGMSFFDPARIPDQVSYLSAFRTLRQDGAQELLGMLRREVMTRKASILVLDGFATAQRAAAGAPGFDEFVHELQGVAIATECTIFLLTSAESRRDSPEYTLVDGIIELSDQLFGWSAESALQIMKLRGSGYLRGKHAFRITDDGIVVFPRIEALLARPSQPDTGGTERVSSGVNRLDTMLGGGLPAKSTTLIMGPTGTGKTTLGLQFLSTCSEAEPGLLFGCYETPARLMVKADAVCRPLRGLIEGGALEVLWHPPTDRLLDAYGQRLMDAVHRRGVRRLFIDGLGAFRNAASETSRIGHFLAALTNELRVLGVTTVYTLEVSDIVGPAVRAPISDVSGIAENVILLRFVELRSRLCRLISILKMRDSDFDPTLHRFVTCAGGLAIDETAERAEAIMAGSAEWPTGVAVPDGTPRPRRSGD